MAGVLFVVRIPTAEYEEKLLETVLNKSPHKNRDQKTQNENSDDSSLIYMKIDESVSHLKECSFKTLPGSSRENLLPNTSCEDHKIDIDVDGVSPLSGTPQKALYLTSVTKDIKKCSMSSIQKAGKIVNKSWEGLKDIMTSSKNKRRIAEETSEEGSPNFKTPMEKVLANLLNELKVTNAMWQLCRDSLYYQVVFPVGPGGRCEATLASFGRWGIGARLGSFVGVLPCTLLYQAGVGTPDNAATTVNGTGNNVTREENATPHNMHKKKDHNAKTTAWNRFLSSVRARLTVAQVVENVKAHSTLTFDFMALLLIATLLAALGLVENNNIFLVSSMLISPLMGPVIAGTFGTVIQDKKLFKIGVTNELLGLGLATLVGFLYGLMICTISGSQYGEGDWPTREMLSWCSIRTLWVGCLVALLSGAAVALGILGDHMGSLVGVAISASLLPPAVNAGLLWSISMYFSIFNINDSISSNIFSKNQSTELSLLGVCSMCLTFLNIICIYLVGILIFKLKEVAPLSSKDQARRFWKHDIKVVRDHNRTLQNEDAKIIRNRLAAELAAAEFETHPMLNQTRHNEFNNTHLQRSIELPRSETAARLGRNQVTWSPSAISRIQEQQSVEELEDLYLTLTGDLANTQRMLNFKFSNPISTSYLKLPHCWTAPRTQPLSATENVFPFETYNTSTDTTVRQEETATTSNRNRRNAGTRFTVTPVLDTLND